MWGSKKKAEPKGGGGPPFSQLADGFSLAEPAFPSSSFPPVGGAAEKAPKSLREIIKDHLMENMIGPFAKEPAGVVMLVDKLTLRVLSSVCKMSELLEENIHLVENITMKTEPKPGAEPEYLRRQPLPALPALYFITPTVESVNRLISDFRDKKRPMYAAAHLFFSSRLPDTLLMKLKNSPAIGRVASFKEVNLELACIESNAFVLDAPHALPALFAPDEAPSQTEAKLQEQHRLANMLATLCAQLGERPHIRHCNRPVATSVSRILHDKLEEMSRPGFFGPGTTFPSRVQSDAERPLLLVLDRSFDALSPLLHEFTYQAMVHDLLPLEGERYRHHYVGSQDQQLSKEVLLNDTDPLWTRLRALHIADLSQLLHHEFTEFVKAHPEAAKLTKQGGGQRDLKGMSEGLRGMPKFQETSARYSLHTGITQALMRKYAEASLESIATLEQNMATGEDSGGRAFKTALPELRAVLERADLLLSPEDKLRLLMIYMITQDGIRQDERRQLIQLADISPEDQDAIINLFYLGVTLLQGTNHKKRPTKKGAAGAEEGYDVSRYAPPLKRALDDLLGPGLSTADFPFVGQHEAAAGGGKAAGAKGKAGGGAGGDAVPHTGRRVIVFMLGGMSYSELRSVHEVAEGARREVISGATCMLTPKTYLLALKQLKQLEPVALV